MPSWRNPRWLQQIVTIQDKGYDARLAGKPVTDCPYQGGYRNQNGAGGGLQRQRRRAWIEGWELADREQKEREK